MKKILMAALLAAMLTLVFASVAQAHTTFNGKVRIVCLGDNRVKHQETIFETHVTRVTDRGRHTIRALEKYVRPGPDGYNHIRIDKSYVKRHTSRC